MKEIAVKGKRLKLVCGDITGENVDAIVNAANSGLLGGGGVDGAIHRAGGPEILKECKKIRSSQGRCPTGKAVITTAGRLQAKKVIHTVGPIWSGGTRGEPELLAQCYRNSLRLADENGLRTVAFPSISTGAYRFPIDRAAPIALKTVVGELEMRDIEEVRFVLFTQADLEAYSRALDEIEKKP
ncbi:MAG: O-acetyl-ADP-ribose deacetylase [Candidatus Krumholzibacteria bacterium]|nr:O-acetyl-ADP-ribose deacetylase [Candidatus Krumholzibacteria bacterium]